MFVQDLDMPCFHGQGLPLRPKPREVHGKHQEKKSLETVAVVHGMPGLTQSTEQVAGDEDHPKKQHTFVQPAGHATT